MAQGKSTRKTYTASKRKSVGFLPAAGLIGQQMRTAQAKRGYAQARLEALWPDLVGPEIAEICAPEKLTQARGPAGGLLKLAVEGAHAPQVQMMLPTIQQRINAGLGPGTVGRIQLTQSVLPARPARPASQRHMPLPATALPEPMTASLSSIGDDELRDALQTLARNVVSRARHPRTLEDQDP